MISDVDLQALIFVLCVCDAELVYLIIGVYNDGEPRKSLRSGEKGGN